MHNLNQYVRIVQETGKKIPFTVIYALHVANAVDASDALFHRTVLGPMFRL